MARRPRLSDRVCETLDDIKEEYEYNDDDSAIRHVLREADYSE